jgi:hypothetical protein
MDLLADKYLAWKQHGAPSLSAHEDPSNPRWPQTIVDFFGNYLSELASTGILTYDIYRLF